MPWIEEEIKHKDLLDTIWWKILRRFKDVNGNYWWPNINEDVEKVDLYKIVFERGLFVIRDGEYRISSTTSEGKVSITRHMIMRRWDGELIGLAMSTGAVDVDLRGVPNTQRGIFEFLSNVYYDYVDYTTLYAYMLDRYEGLTHYKDEEGNIRPVTIMVQDYGNGVMSSSLDVEFYNEYMYYPEMMQSPIVKIKLIDNNLNTVQSVGKLNYRTNTNWWEDSIVRVKGFVDETSFFFTFQADTAPVWEDNKVVIVPLFFGNLILPGGERGSTVLFGGTQVPHYFDFDSIEEKTEVIQPVTRNYVYYPSNGVDSVMVKRTKHGAWYQAHYLRWNAPANHFPPKREVQREEEDFVRKYPRSWNYLRDGYYQYVFHPSRYSGKLHASKAYVVHPEDGVAGHLPNIVLVPAVNLSEGGILESVSYCTQCDEEGIGYNPPVPPEPEELPDWNYF